MAHKKFKLLILIYYLALLPQFAVVIDRLADIDSHILLYKLKGMLKIILRYLPDS